MKVTYLKIQNIGLIADTTIELNKPLIILYGEIRQGKTTVLNAVRWVCGGSFPTDIIRKGEKEASIELGFAGGMISRSFYVAKDGKTTKAREVVFVRNGKPVPSPVGEIKRMLNPFLLDQDFLRNKSELERRQYFTELFAVDTTDLDTEAFNKDREATQLRATIKGYGEIDLTEVKSVDVTHLKSQRATIIAKAVEERGELEQQLKAIDDEHTKAVDAVNTRNADARISNAKRVQLVDRSASIGRDIAQLEERIRNLKNEKEGVDKQIEATPERAQDPLPPAPDTTELKKRILALHSPDTAEIDAKLQDAGATNVRAEQYQKNLERSKQRIADQEKLSVLENRLREIKAEKQAKLKDISDQCGIAELSFDADGNFIYQGSQAGMLSTSQIMKLSSELSALYPEGFGLELLDRGESLGRSIFDYIELAKKKKSTVLATIVGERPSKIPAETGVFVVKDGTVIPDDKEEGKLL